MSMPTIDYIETDNERPVIFLANKHSYSSVSLHQAKKQTIESLRNDMQDSLERLNEYLQEVEDHTKRINAVQAITLENYKTFVYHE